MAVTHADLEIQGRRRELGSKAGTAVIVFCFFCGLLGFVFSVLAECSKTKVSDPLYFFESSRAVSISTIYLIVLKIFFLVCKQSQKIIPKIS